jgi:hypothetical protein
LRSARNRSVLHAAPLTIGVLLAVEWKEPAQNGASALVHHVNVAEISARKSHRDERAEVEKRLGAAKQIDASGLG